ncbi:ABC transporter ATP-binding protein [Pedococcus sp. P5_B7]
MLEIKGLVTGYSGTAVVRDLSLSVEPGQIVTLLGPNGAGKTTTLRTVYGLLHPMRGTVTFDGRDISKLKSSQIAKSGVGYVPEGRALAPSLTVAENLRLVDNWSIDPYEIFPELHAIQERRVGLLSGGEQQMLAVVRSLVTGPRILLVDELSFGLAPVLVDRLLVLLRAMVDKGALGVLLVEQYVKHALAFSDTAHVLVHGNVVLSCPAEELVRDPQLLKASYLGAAV